jgi:hypothetical protein
VRLDHHERLSVRVRFARLLEPLGGEPVAERAIPIGQHLSTKRTMAGWLSSASSAASRAHRARPA